MRVADIVTASVLLLVSGVVVFDAVRLGIGWSTDGPRSGFLAFWLGVLMIAVCAVIVALAARRGDPRPFVTPAPLRPGLTMPSSPPALRGLPQWLRVFLLA